MVIFRKFCVASAMFSLCLSVAGCTIKFTNNLIPDPTPAPESVPVPALTPAPIPAPIPVPKPTAGDVDSNSLANWDFASSGETSGWRMGWNKSEEAAITDFDAEPKLGLKLTMDFHASAWGDANIKTAWTDAIAPVALRVKILIPVSSGRPKGPMQMGCAMNMPWTEAKHWPTLKGGDTVVIDGIEYLLQTVTCRLGTSSISRVPGELVVRFGGDRIRYKGPMYIQRIQALAESN